MSPGCSALRLYIPSRTRISRARITCLVIISGLSDQVVCLACGSPSKLSCVFLQAFHFLNRTAVNILRTLAAPQALGVGVPTLDVLLDDAVVQPDQPSQSRLSFTQTCSTSEQQPCKPCKDGGLLTLIFIDQPAGLQVSTSCFSQLQVRPLLHSLLYTSNSEQGAFPRSYAG